MTRGAGGVPGAWGPGARPGAEGRTAVRLSRVTAHTWTFLTNHAHVLLAIARLGDPRVADIAATVGITERQALSILADLEAGGYLTRVKDGRRTHYQLARHQPFRHPALRHHDVDELLAIFATDDRDGRRTR